MFPTVDLKRMVGWTWKRIHIWSPWNLSERQQFYKEAGLKFQSSDVWLRPAETKGKEASTVLKRINGNTVYAWSRATTSANTVYLHHINGFWAFLFLNNSCLNLSLRPHAAELVLLAHFIARSEPRTVTSGRGLAAVTVWRLLAVGGFHPVETGNLSSPGGRSLEMRSAVTQPRSPGCCCCWNHSRDAKPPWNRRLPPPISNPGRLNWLTFSPREDLVLCCHTGMIFLVSRLRQRTMETSGGIGRALW